MGLAIAMSFFVPLSSFVSSQKDYKGINQAIPVKEVSPNGTGIYSKNLAYSLILYAGGSRFSHVLYLGSEQILSTLLPQTGCPTIVILNGALFFFAALSYSTSKCPFSLSQFKLVSKSGNIDSTLFQNFFEWFFSSRCANS